MPISKSAKKALRSSEAKASRNRYRKALLKDALKKVSAESISMVDKAAKWGIIHPNKADRLKSQIAKQVKIGPKAKAAPATKAKKAAAPKRKTVKK